jgi:hypothetical protein
MGLAPPYLGAPSTLRMLFGLDTTFSQDLEFAEVGITPKMFKHTVAILKGFYNLLPKDTLKHLKDKKFVQALQARIDAEHHGISVTTNTVLDLLPQADESCMPHFTSRDEFCKYGFSLWNDFGHIEETRITHDNIVP